MVIPKKVFLLLVIIQFSYSQKPNVDNRRHDVYIAGFFPFGKGVENSNTGKGQKYYNKIFTLLKFYLNYFFTILINV